MNKNGLIDENGFSLIELSISLFILGIIATAVMPSFIMGIRQQAAKKTAIEISQIQEAGRKYFITNNYWPANFSTLAAGYLDPTWSATNLNPFGNPYSVSINGNNLVVQTNVPADVYLVTGANLPMVTYTAVTGQSLETVASTVTPQGGGNPGLGTPIPVSSGTIYYANTDGFLVGYVWTAQNFVYYQVYSDSSSHPGTDDGGQATYSSNNGGPVLKVMVNSLVHKGNYYQFNYLAGQGYSVNFIPLNA